MSTVDGAFVGNGPTADGAPLGGGGTDRVMLTWGGAVNSSTDFLEVQSAGIGGVITGARGALTDMTPAFSGRITHISWQTFLGDATTDFNLYAGAGVAETFRLTGASGFAQLTGFSVTAGQALAVEYIAGTVPSFSTVQLWMEIDA